MNFNRFFQELKRRRVYQVAITYGITAWLLAQVASLATTSFEAPVWVMKFIILFLLVGFPIALVVGWVFELTPEGIVKTPSLEEEKQVARSDNHQFNRRLNWVLGGIIGVLVLLLIYLSFGVENRVGFSKENEGIKSIAVLPFDSYTTEEEHQYFAEAIADEIRSQLLNVNGLKVVSGYSSKYYKGQNFSPKQVGDELGVDYILQGNVQQLANSVKVGVELSHTQSNNLEWSPSPFERNMEDIFRLENDIAQQIVSQLRVRISSEEKEELESLPTENPQAYQLFLRAQELLHRNRANIAELDQATDLFKQAIMLDPNFDRAHLGLAEAYMEYCLWGRISAFDGANKALNAVFRVSDNTSAEYIGLLGAINFNRREKDLAEDFLERSLEMNSNFLLAQVRLAWMVANDGDIDKAISLMNAAQSLDPKDPIHYGYKGFVWYYSGDFEKAMSTLDEGLAIHPDDNWLKWVKGYIYSGMGEYEKAIEQFTNRTVARQTNWMIGYCYGKLGETEKARFVLDYLLNRRKQGHVPAHMIASVYMGLGDFEKTIDWLEIDEKEGGHEHFYWGIPNDIKFDPLKDIARFQALIDRL